MDEPTLDFERLCAELDAVPVVQRGTVVIRIDVRELRALIAIRQLARDSAWRDQHDQINQVRSNRGR